MSQTADAVYGQPDFTSNGFNNGGPQSGLGLLIDLAIDRTGRLFVADSGNNRVLLYAAPLINNLPGCVFGQLGSLTVTDINHGLGPFATDGDGFFWLTGLAFDRTGDLLVADTNNQHVLRFNRVVPALQNKSPVNPPLSPLDIEPWPP